MGKLISAVLGSILVLLIVAGGPGVWYYENHFQGFHFGGVPLVHWFAFTIPPGVGVQLAELEAKDAAATKAAQAHVAAVVAQQGQVNATVAADQTKAQAAIRVVTKTLIQRIPQYVTAQADADCVVSSGFVSLWNDAAAGRVPPVPGGGPDADVNAPSGVALSQVSTADIETAGDFYALRSEVLGWRQWYAGQRAAFAASAAVPNGRAAGPALVAPAAK